MSPIASSSGPTPGGSHIATPPQPSTESAVPLVNASPAKALTNGGQYVRYWLASGKSQRTGGSLLNAMVSVAMARASSQTGSTSICCSAAIAIPPNQILAAVDSTGEVVRMTQPHAFVVDRR